jgi:ATP-dependent Clp protease, protease subunit
MKYDKNLTNEPYVLENDNENDNENEKDERELSPTMRLLYKRQIVISESISSKMTDKIIKQLLILNNEDTEKPITIIINSPGGEVYSGFGIFDMIRLVKAPVKTIICGLAASMGSIISLATSKENRMATPNSKIMIHQPLISGLMGGPISDIEIEANEMMRVKQRIVDLYVEETGHDEKEIRKLIERNRWMTADEALNFGHIGKIINSLDDIE